MAAQLKGNRSPTMPPLPTFGSFGLECLSNNVKIRHKCNIKFCISLCYVSRRTGIVTFEICVLFSITLTSFKRLRK